MCVKCQSLYINVLLIELSYKSRVKRNPVVVLSISAVGHQYNSTQ